MRSLILSLTIAAGLVVGIASSNVGCSSADAAFDCHSVCQRYKECYNDSFDVGKCSDDCRSAASKDTSYRDKADKCEKCIGDKSCLSTTFACGIDCAGVINPNP